ncbi:olfactory receptor 2K2 [Nothobranchius furzeri]|uniref:Olfactory receptor 2K2 n=1 Tax=Nothobranchius furzeri TaxID=105023 RepID=A0A9D2XQT8_NOTFU|nr:olfactory receptor 2K2 [Nothobranchius furzeri]
MENQTVVAPLRQPIEFELEGFDVPSGYGPFLFLLALLVYMLVLLGNGVVLCAIVMDQNLHRPMFIMICHLLICDLLGSTAMVPCLMMQLLLGQKKIVYLSAIAQAFCVHTYGMAMQTVLGVMAYDRWERISQANLITAGFPLMFVFFMFSVWYVAVCEPLRYCSIMTSSRLHSCCALAWTVALLLIAVLFSFHVNVPLCGRVIRHVYCSNRGILDLFLQQSSNRKFSCGFLCFKGLSITWSMSSGVFLVIAFSYFRILRASLRQGRTDSSIRSKALQTCASHLVVYVIYEMATTIIVVSYRFPSASQNIKKFFSILFIMFPPAINPIIYGLVSKELRSSIVKRFSTRVTDKT